MTTTEDWVSTRVPPAITTPPTIDAGIGQLEFADGYPTVATAAKLRDHLDNLHGVEAFMNSIQGVSLYAVRQGFLAAGIIDGDVLIFSELMDSRSLFLTANADTVYFLAFLDLSNGPLIINTPADSLGLVDDMWFGWITDFGLPGADRGQGGRYLLLPPGYDGPMPEGGHFVRRSTTNRVVLLGRAFIDQNEGNDPAPTAARIKEQLKIYPYVAGGVGHSIGSYLTGGGQTRSMLQTPQRYPRAGSRAIPRPQPCTRRTDPPSSTPHLGSRKASLTATGSRPTPTRVGSSPCACTAGCNRSSTRPGDPVRSSS